jgi:dienelactone hydrolase
MPGYWLGGNLYRPLGRPGRHPGVVSPHGHWTYGRLEHQPLGSIPARAINLARQGYVVFAYDMVGYTDTIQTPHVFGDQREMLWGFGPLGLQLWNSIRAVDFITSLPDVDPQRIAATGASGGGSQTFLLTAVDDRIRYSAPVNMISGIMQGGSPCENAPGLRIDTSNLEIAALMAPRPMLMVSATGDWTKNTPQSEFPQLRHIWQLYSADSRLENVHIDAPHNYNRESREAMYRFFGKNVLELPDAAKLTERDIRVEKLGDMLVWHARSLPAGALDHAGVFRQWVRFAEAHNDSIRDKAAAKERLRLALHSEWPDKVEAERNGERVVLSRTGRGDRVPGILIGTGTPSRLVLAPEGAEAARKSGSAGPIAPGEAVLLIDAFQTGSAKASRDRSHRHFLTFNKSDDAERVQDVLTALAWMEQQGVKTLKVSGTGTAGLWAVFAAAVAPVPVSVSDVPKSFTGTDDQFIRDFFVPGIQRAGGWRAALLAAGLQR